MAGFVGIDLTGDKKLMRAFEALGERGQQRASKKAVRAGSVPMVRAMRQRVPVGETKRLRKSIGKKEKVYQGTFLIVCGPRIKMGKHSGSHGHLIEFGTEPRYTESGAYRGVGPAMHPIEQAYDATKDDALSRVMLRLWREIEIEAEKARRGG